MKLACQEKWVIAGLTLLVALAVLALFAPSLGYGYVGLDDDLYVVNNPAVKDGFSGEAVKAAWTTVTEAYWAPLLWMSFMVDVEWHGLKPWGFHLTNVLLYSLNAALLFWLVRRWTGRTGVALATVLLWAFHPARVESVAWITERKDVLSGLFFLLGIGAYVEGRRRNRAGGIVLAWLCMGLGGLVKQIMIVMPVALMLLDVWPLGRTDWNRIWRDGWRLASEKWAFWGMALALAGLPIWFHYDQGLMLDVSIGHRLAMIPIHYLFYFQKLIWPVGLMPLQADLPFRWWTWALGLGILIGMPVGLWRCRARAPWALMGWLWFVVLLFPLSGVVWAGQERLATRFLYVPQMGLTLAVVLAADGFVRARGWRLRWGAIACALVVAGYAGQTLRLLPHWRDKATFGEWVWRCNPGHGTACVLGGDALVVEGDWAKADETFARGVVMQNKSCLARLCRLRNWCGQTEWSEMIWDTFERVTGRPLLEPDRRMSQTDQAILWDVRGQILWAKGERAAAIEALKQAVALEKDPAAFVVAEFLRMCYEAGRPEEGASVAARLKAAKGTDIRAWGDLLPRYMQLWQEGGRGHAYGFFLEHAKRYPEDGAALNNMAWLLATAEPDGMGHAHMEEWPAQAVAWAERAVELSETNIAGVWDTLAAARANANDFEGAMAAGERAMALAKLSGEWTLASKLQVRVEGYRAGKPWREADERAKNAGMKQPE